MWGLLKLSSDLATNIQNFTEVDRIMPKKKASSRKKRSTKAVTPTRSTTSLTTAKTASKIATKKKATRQLIEQTTDELPPKNVPISTAEFLKKSDSPTLLSDDLQYSYMTLLSRGASPAAACAQLGILLADVIWTMEHDSGFQSMMNRVQELLSQNVAAALYRSAMEGSVSAQQNYLKAYPPPGCGATTDGSENDPEHELTDEELIAYLKQEATAFLAELNQDDALEE